MGGEAIVCSGDYETYEVDLYTIYNIKTQENIEAIDDTGAPSETLRKEIEHMACFVQAHKGAPGEEWTYDTATGVDNGDGTGHISGNNVTLYYKDDFQAGIYERSIWIPFRNTLNVGKGK